VRGCAFIAPHIVDVTIGSMATEETLSTSQNCPACGASIDTSGAEPLARVACPKCGEKVRVERTFDHFVLLETLGIGGMGTVYKARDTLLDRMVALKLLRKDLGTGVDHASHLRQEARQAAAVNHPNVVQVFSSGTDHEQFYLVMELIEHGSLDDLIEQKRRLSEEQVLEAGIQVAKGLRAAHAKGLIHQDVKPANVLFADEHTAKISDFGLAGVAAQNSETRGEIWATPYYVAPERLNNEPQDFRSDIYSLGATLFHAVAGKAPIQGETSSAAELRTLKSHPLDLRKVAPQVSAETAHVLNRMIAPDPARRFSSYDELLTELELANRALTGKEDVDLARERRKRRQIFAISAAALVALIAISGVFLVHKWQTRIQSKVSAPAIPAAELERQYNEARHQLVAGKHNVAHDAFARIAVDAKNRQPLYDWVCLHEGLTAMIARDQPQAQQAFQEVDKVGSAGFAKEDVDLAKFFVATAKTMLAPGVVTPVGAGAVSAKNFQVFALFLFALKDIAQSDANDAISLLEQFLAREPQGKFTWIAEYKPLAQKYFDDCQLYLAWKSRPASSKNAAELAALKKKLKTHSAISDEINAEEKKLTGGVVVQVKPGSTATARSPEPKATGAVGLAGWGGAQDNYKKRVAVYDFAGAVAAIKNVQLSDASQKQAQQTMQKKAQWLVEWKNKLIDDLNRVPFTGAITDVDGVPYTAVTGATAQDISLRLPYGAARIPWTKLPPQTLLALSTSFVKPNEPDAADRQWRCAAFASETGQTDAARQLAEAAATSKPEYRENISLLVK
jgi:serine/threonine protein kinase